MHKSSKAGWGEWPGEVGGKQDYSPFPIHVYMVSCEQSTGQTLHQLENQKQSFAPHAKAPQTHVCALGRKRSETTEDSILSGVLGKQKGRFPLCSHSTKQSTAFIHSIKMTCTALYHKSWNTHTHTGLILILSLSLRNFQRTKALKRMPCYKTQGHNLRGKQR